MELARSWLLSFSNIEFSSATKRVPEELVALRKESQRVFLEQVKEGSALRSQLDSAAARELDANTLLLQSQLDYIQARDEMTVAIGQTPD